MMGGCIGAFGRFRLPRNATKVGKNGALRRVGPAKTSRRDNGVCRVVPRPTFGKQPARMPVKAPILAQILQHQRRQRDDTVLMAFATANDELALFAEDIVNAQREAFA